MSAVQALSRRTPLNPVSLLRRVQVELGIGNLPTAWLERRYGKPESRFIDVDGIRIHYTDEGNQAGPVLVLLHGVLASLHTWDGWVKALGAHYRIIRLDIPGFGLSSRLPSDQYQPDRAVEFIDRGRY